MSPNPQSLIPNTTLDADVRRFDEDRWLASRFAPAYVRAPLIAVYALNGEIARTAAVVTQAAIGDIRLAWWREAICEIYDGKPVREHPVLLALADAVRGGTLSRELFEALIEARASDLDAAPFADWAALERYVDATAGNVMQLALAACGADAESAPLTEAARAWGYTGLARNARNPLQSGGATVDALLERAEEALAKARAKALSAAAFPAVGYVALVPGYIRALRRDERARPLLLRQLRLVGAAVTGRL